VDSRRQKENYFTTEKVDELKLVMGQGQMTDQSRVISGQFEKILDSLPFYVMLVDTDHNIQFANNAFRQSFGLSLKQVQGQYCPKLVHGLDHPYHGCPVQQAIKGGNTEKEYFNEDIGRWLLTTAYPTGAKTKEGLDIYFHTVRDITEEKLAQQSLEVSEKKYHRLFEEMQDVIFIMSPEGMLLEINRAGLELLQIPSRIEIPRTNIFNDLALIDCEWDPFIDSLRKQGHIIDYEVSFKRDDGQIIIISINATLEQDEEGEDQVIRGLMRDLTLHRELEQQSTTDQLTSLYNHGYFHTCLTNRVRHACGDNDRELSVLFLDIDDFKAYNDAYGHQEGDYILCKVAESIMTAVRNDDIAARYGGEEFTIILGCDFDMARTVAERIRETVEDRCSPVTDSRVKKSITVSIGLSTFGRDAVSAGHLVKAADNRMYDAKKHGKNRVFTGEDSAAA
jgi:diguanylate cyclase (GGDEF)-like protein/PAS domain S-box-containing protein